MKNKIKNTTTNKGGCLWRVVRVSVAVVLSALVVVAATGALVYSDYRKFEASPILEEGQVKSLVIPRGTAWPGVVSRVADARLVPNPYYFDAWGRQTGLAEEVRAGNFSLEGPLTLEELAEILRRGGSVDEVVITFPEGLTIFHMADRLEAAGLADRTEFLELVREPSRFGLGEEAETLEGYLYPDTYRFRQGASAEDIVWRLLRRHQEIVEPLYEAHAKVLEGLTQTYEMDRHEVIILASLIERETGVTDERDLIARVFYNRLDRGMMLQTDPTCVYGEATYLEIPSPGRCRDPLNRYSTYVIRGLPPGPIASPGRASIEAALRPSELEEAREYLFFVARRDGSGSHYFSKTYAEHRRAIRQYLMSE